jgi:hypothetical protein
MWGELMSPGADHRQNQTLAAKCYLRKVFLLFFSFKHRLLKLMRSSIFKLIWFATTH